MAVPPPHHTLFVVHKETAVVTTTSQRKQATNQPLSVVAEGVMAGTAEHGIELGGCK